MTSFFLLAALLVVLAVALLLAGPLRARASASRESDLRATNIALARERRGELVAALDAGQIDQPTHDHELTQLERALAAELDALPERDARDGAIPAAVLVALFVPITAGALYLHLGEPRALDWRADRAASGGDATATAQAGVQAGANGAGAGAAGAPPAAAMSDLLQQLEERLAREPDDVQGWRLLGRSYLGVEAFGRAASALRRAVAIDDDHAPTLGQLAEAVAMSRGGALAGEPVELLDRVLAIDPVDPQGLWLRAIAHQQAGTHREALALFERLRTTIASDTAAVAAIDGMMNRSRVALGEPVSDASPAVAGDGTAAETAAESAAESAAETTAETTAGGDPSIGGTPAAADASAPVTGQTGESSNDGTASLTVSVALSDEARAGTRPDEIVFVYARASEGPPMPLAVARHTVADLPLTVTLDESMAMMPGMSLGRFPEVTVGARVSRSGEAIAASGDWYAEREGVAVGDSPRVELLIDTRRP